MASMIPMIHPGPMVPVANAPKVATMKLARRTPPRHSQGAVSGKASLHSASGRPSSTQSVKLRWPPISGGGGGAGGGPKVVSHSSSV